jgi:hypothetical protein
MAALAEDTTADLRSRLSNAISNTVDEDI